MGGSGRAQASPDPLSGVEHTFARKAALARRVDVEQRVIGSAVGLFILGIAGPVLRAIWPY